MERLTTRDNGHPALARGYEERFTEPSLFFMLLNRLAAYEDTGLGPEEVMQTKLAIMGKSLAEIKEFEGVSINRMIELAQAEKDGRLVVLPCKVGDTVYEANKRGFVSTYEVISIHVSSCSILVGWNLVDGIYSNLNGFEISTLGKTVFLTREEAEAALKKREELRHMGGAHQIL